MTAQFSQQMPQQGVATPAGVTPFSISEDIQANIIFVRGTKFLRQEAGKLIAMLDVSELPGMQSVLKPISVPILNTSPGQVQMQVWRVFQQKIQSTRLPGGVMPQIFPDNMKGTLEIIAPEPLASELKAYAEEVDRMILENPGRKIHVIPLNVKAQVLLNSYMQMQRIQQQANWGNMWQPQPYGMVMPMWQQPGGWRGF